MHTMLCAGRTAQHVQVLRVNYFTIRLFINLFVDVCREIREIAQMQRVATAKKQVTILTMLTQITGFVHDTADKTTRDWADLNKRIDEMHVRCVTKPTQRSYDIGIEAATRRNERQKIEDEKNLSRKDAQVHHFCYAMHSCACIICVCVIVFVHAGIYEKRTIVVANNQLAVSGIQYSCG